MLGNDEQANSSDTIGEDKLLREIFIAKVQLVFALPSSCGYQFVILSIQAELVSEFEQGVRKSRDIELSCTIGYLHWLKLSDNPDLSSTDLFRFYLQIFIATCATICCSKYIGQNHWISKNYRDQAAP